MSEGNNTLTAGDLVGTNYEILGIVGAGGMGIVYRSRDKRLDRIVALKFLPPEMDQNEREREYFLLEARTASSLDHPNIGVIHAIEETSDGRSFIVMAFYDGQSLEQRIRHNHGPLSLPETVEIAIQIANGLSAAHAQRIVHRDIKPSNIMITPSGSIRIVDFGLARIISAETATATGITGTVKYMSPEQALGHRIDQRTDIWSLGVIMAEMLTGSNPFDRKTVSAILVAVLNEPPNPMGDGVPVEMQRIVYRALSKHPETRYQECAELLVDLELFRASISSGPRTKKDSTRGRSSTRSGDIRKFVEGASTSAWRAPERRRMQWLPWALAGALLVLGLLFFLFPGVRERIQIASVSASEKHVAVLPFKTSGNNPEDDTLVEGLVDSLAGKLSNLDVDNKALWVIPTSEIRRLKVTDPATAMKDFGANYVVSGNVLRDGKGVNLSLNLIDTQNQRLVGSTSVEDQSGDLATLQDQAVAKLAKLMNLATSPGTMKNVGGTAAPAAYEDYLTAVGYMERYDKPGNLDRAITSLQNAIGTDQNFALGRAQLGEAYRLKYVVDQNPRWLNEAEANARKAVELDGQIPAAYVTLALIHDVNGRHDLALQEFQQALKLDSLNAPAMRGLARAYERSGRIDEAEATFQRAVALRPNDWDIYTSYALFYYRQGKYAQTIAQYKKALELTPDNSQVLANLGGVYIDTGDAKQYPLAEQALKRSLAIAPSFEAYANLGFLYLRELRFQEGAAAGEKALSMNDKNYEIWNNLLICQEWLKLPDKAEETRRRLTPLLEQAIKTDPRDSSAQSILAMVTAEEHEKENSLSHLQTALALTPNDPKALIDAAGVYEVLGDRKQAILYATRSLKNGLKEDDLRSYPEVQALLKDPAIQALRKN